MYDIINMSFKCLPFLDVTSIRNYKYSPSLEAFGLFIHIKYADD